jgi:cytochrome bd ubiquinol oxidase subunit I
MGVAAWHLLKKQHLDVFEPSFRIGLVVGLVSAVLVAVTGDMHGVNVSKTQPAKLAAMESHWETQTRAPWCCLPSRMRKMKETALKLVRFPVS